MMALVDDERVGADAGGVELVGTQQPQHIDAAVQHCVKALAVRARQEAQIERTDTRGGGVQHVEAVPVGGQRADLRGEAPGGGEDRGAVGTGQRALPDDDHRLFRVAQRLGEVVRAVVQRRSTDGPVPRWVHG